MQRQVVHRALQRLRQLGGDYHGAVGVVALADVQQPGQTREGAVVVAVQPELATAQGQDDGILSELFSVAKSAPLLKVFLTFSGLVRKAH